MILLINYTSFKNRLSTRDIKKPPTGRPTRPDGTVGSGGVEGVLGVLKTLSIIQESMILNKFVMLKSLRLAEVGKNFKPPGVF